MAPPPGASTVEKVGLGLAALAALLGVALAAVSGELQILFLFAAAAALLVLASFLPRILRVLLLRA